MPDAAYERNKSEHEPIISLNRSKERVEIVGILMQTTFIFAMFFLIRFRSKVFTRDKKISKSLRYHYQKCYASYND